MITNCRLSCASCCPEKFHWLCKRSLLFLQTVSKNSVYKPDKFVNANKKWSNWSNGFVGDFNGLHAYFEYFQVWPIEVGIFQMNPTDIFKGTHAGVHFALGGYIFVLNRLFSIIRH